MVRYLRRMVPEDGRYDFDLTGSMVCSAFLFFLTGCSTSPDSTFTTILPLEKNGEAISFLGDTLFRPEDDETTFLQKDSLLREANTIYQTDSSDLNSIIWYGRRLAAMYRFKEAVVIFSTGISFHPGAPELYRHRGQLYIIMRLPDAAIADLQKAAALSMDRMIETEPDAIPNQLDLPLTNLRFNIYYQLGLAWYLKGEYQKAVDAFSSCHPYAVNPDLTVAEMYWLYQSILRLGEKYDADSLLTTLDPYAEIFQHEPYLETLLKYASSMNTKDQPLIKPDSLADGIELYGICNWYRAHNRQAEASSLRHRILASPDWINIGYIAAEADSSRLLVQ